MTGNMGSMKSFDGVTPSARNPLLNPGSTDGKWEITMNRVILDGNKVIIDFPSVEVSHKFLELLKQLGVTGNIEKKEIKLKYDEKFREYLLKDRGLHEKTARWYMNYLKKLDGETINYDLYLKICDNKWKVKLVRVYLDYLYKKGELSWEEKERLKSIFKVKEKKNRGEYKINKVDLFSVIFSMKEGSLYRLILELLYFSGARLSEVVKMLREWNEKNLKCFYEKGFCRYELMWERGRKRCDYIYFPIEYVEKIRKYAGKVGKYDNLRKNIFDYYGIKPKEFRKFHYRMCRKVLKKEVCVFYQSRIGSLDTSDTRYDELRTKSDRGYPKLMNLLYAEFDAAEMLYQEVIKEPRKNEILMKLEPDDPEPDEEERDFYEFNLWKELESLNSETTS